MSAKVLAAAGRRDEAIVLAGQAVALVERTDATNERADASLSLAHVHRFAGNAAEATWVAEIALKLFEQKENEGPAAQTRTFLRSVAQPSPA